jgi:putative membrane protein insertion efficiency factor
MRCLRFFVLIPSAILIGMVRLYQIFLSPFLGGQCRFQPTCSHYFIEAVKKYGAISGSIRGIRRILRCHPYHPGGYDPP